MFLFYIKVFYYIWLSSKSGNTSATPLQKVDYTYNIRGWMKSINNPKALQQGSDPGDLFGFKINYNTVEGNLNAANNSIMGILLRRFGVLLKKTKTIEG